MQRHHPAIWFLPAGMLLGAMAPLPYGFYVLLRIVVAVAAGFLAYKDYEARNGVSGWAVVLGTIAVLFNPIIPIHLSREIWLPINAVAAAIFGVHWMKSRKQ